MNCCCCSYCCGYCSECVGCAACNTTLCSYCITGLPSTFGDCMGPGSDVPITPPSTDITCVDVSSCLPFAGTDESGNDIYQLSCGKLVYSDGSEATQADIACNCGACRGTVCSPRTCGTTTQAPRASGSGGGAPQGGGSGAGSAKSAGSNAQCNKGNAQLTALSKAMSNLGATMTSLLTGGKKTAVGGTTGMVAGVTPSTLNCAMSSNSFLLVIFIVGALLLMMAFGHGREA